MTENIAGTTTAGTALVFIGADILGAAAMAGAVVMDGMAGAVGAAGVLSGTAANVVPSAVVENAGVSAAGAAVVT
jgi:hypothetical protein